MNSDLTHYPLLIFAFSFIALWISERIGLFFRGRRGSPEEDFSQDYGIVLAATLTLLGLVIGFTFSMATSRYDQRKDLEEAEANAIGTEYLRAQLLPAADTARVQSLLKQYLEQRVLFYGASDQAQRQPVDAATAKLQTALWSAVLAPAATQPTPLVALVVAGMNDVLNSQGYTEAAWQNRIPNAAWALMTAIALCSSWLVGYGSRSAGEGAKLLLVLPLVVSIAFMLIADIDAPSHGLIKVRPQNLISLAESLRGQ